MTHVSVKHFFSVKYYVAWLMITYSSKCTSYSDFHLFKVEFTYTCINIHYPFQCVNLAVRTGDVELFWDYNVNPDFSVLWKMKTSQIRLEAAVKVGLVYIKTI